MRSFHGGFALTAAALPHRSIKEAAEQLQEEFIKLIEQHYFPLDSWDTEWIRDRFPFIPIHLENYDCESEFEEAPLPICIAAAWVGHYSYAPPGRTFRKNSASTLQFHDAFESSTPMQRSIS